MWLSPVGARIASFISSEMRRRMGVLGGGIITLVMDFPEDAAEQE
jgi:hypothetical protein